MPSALGRDKIFILLYKNPQKDSHIQILGASQVARVVKNAPANAGDLRYMGVIPGLGRSPEEDMEPTPVSLPGESQEQRSLEGYSP